MPVIAVRHPLVRHKIGLLREDDISTKKFRDLTSELARLLAYEATSDFPLESAQIQCWSGPAEIEQIAGRKVTIVPILRAGLGMLDGVLDLVPNAKISVVGLSRDHETLQPEPSRTPLPGRARRARPRSARSSDQRAEEPPKAAPEPIQKTCGGS